MMSNKALWEKGDFTRIAETMRGSGERLVASLGIVPGIQLLDLGCGDGTTALPAARLGAEVLGVDIARNLLEAGRRRAERDAIHCRFEEGDAADLAPIPDRSFDMVVSIFGAMFAARPFDVAKEMARVTRPGGRIVMGNWIPNDPSLVAQILRTSAAYAPPPPQGFVSPMTWGIEENVIERFAAAGIPGDTIVFKRATFSFDYKGPPEQFVGLFRSYYGPTMIAYEAAESAGRADQLHRQLVDLFESQNVSADPSRTIVHANYLQVDIRKP